MRRRLAGEQRDRMSQRRSQDFEAVAAAAG
jgi:hypothetical protein